MLAAEIKKGAAVMVVAPDFSVPPPGCGRLVITRFSGWLGFGLSLASEKPKSATANVLGVSSAVEITLSAPVGGSLIEVTSIVIVLGVGSRFAPPPVAVPVSCTWNVNFAYAAPLALRAGANVNWLASSAVFVTKS